MQRRFCFSLLLVLASAFLSGQTANRTITLNIVDHVKEADGSATITLASGRKISVSAADVVTPPAPAPPPLTIEDVIKDKCSRDWPKDSRMQVSCQARQHTAVIAISKRQISTTTPEYAIVHAACQKQHPDDFVLRDVCEGQQLKVLKH